MKAPNREHARQAWRRLRGGELTPRRAALSVAVGLAIGVTPLWGLHWILVLAVCVPLRLDAGVGFLASNISLPFIAPFITFAEFEAGSKVLHGTWLGLDPRGLELDDLKAKARTLVAELAIGTVIVATLTSTLGGLITYAIARSRETGRREGGKDRV